MLERSTAVLELWRDVTALYERHRVAIDYEGVLADNYRRFVAAGDCVADVGANIGTHTYHLLSIVGHGGRLAIFEPIAELHQRLRTSLEGHACIELFDVALSNYMGAAPFTVARGAIGESGLKGGVYSDSLTADPVEVQVRVATLDAMLWRWPRLDYLKIDIEGGELDCLAGATQVINRCRPVISFECFPRSVVNYGRRVEDFLVYADEHDLAICDLYGNEVPDLATWRAVLKERVWDFYYVPREKLDWFRSKVRR